MQLIIDLEPAVLGDTDLLRERIQTTTTGLLALIGMTADPITSREHILLANLFENAWTQGKALDLAGLIHAVQAPPFERIGVMDLDFFFPAKDRLAMAMRINNLLAAPGFESWLQGDPLDIGRMLYTPQGKPRASIFSISHLSDTEPRVFRFNAAKRNSGMDADPIRHLQPARDPLYG